MTAEEFVHACQDIGEFDFAYTESTRAASSAHSVRFVDADRVSADELRSILDAELAEFGFATEPIGPAHLRVLLVRPRQS